MLIRFLIKLSALLNVIKEVRKIVNFSLFIAIDIWSLLVFLGDLNNWFLFHFYPLILFALLLRRALSIRLLPLHRLIKYNPFKIIGRYVFVLKFVIILILFLNLNIVSFIPIFMLLLNFFLFNFLIFQLLFFDSSFYFQSDYFILLIFLSLFALIRCYICYLNWLNLSFLLLV